MSPWVDKQEFLELTTARDTLPVVQAALDRKTAYEAIQDETLRLRSQEIAGLNATVHELQLSLAALRLSERVVAYEDDVRARLDEGLKTDVHIGLSPLMESVEAALRPEAERRVTEEIRSGLVATEDARILEEVRVTEGPRILEKQDDTLRKTGVYDDIREKKRLEVARRIRADLIAAVNAEAEEEFKTPENRDAFIAAIAPDIKKDPQVLQYVKALEAKFYPEWRVQGEQLALAKAERQVRARQQDIVLEAAEEFARSTRGKRAIEEVTSTVEKSIKAIAIEDLLRASGDATHKALLDERTQIAAEALARQNISDRLKLEFFNGGIDTSNIEAGTVLEIHLGQVSSKNENIYDHTKGDYRNVKKTVLQLARKLTLTSMGAGSYRVDDDTLQRSKDVYAHAAALAEGDTIAVGMLVSEATPESKETDQAVKATKKPKLLQVLKAGARLHYDTDTSNDDFSDSHLPIANVSVNGVSVREINEINEKLI